MFRKLRLKSQKLKSVNDMYRYLRRTLRKQYDGQAKIKYFDNVPYGNGGTTDDMGKTYPLNVAIGVGGLFIGNDSEQLQHFTAVAVAAFHECRHVDQQLEMRTQDNENVRYMSLSHLAYQNNSQYYFYNRYSLPTEIDAERCGIRDAGQFLSGILKDDKMAEQLLLSYVNTTIDNWDYYIQCPIGKRSYDNINDVLIAFDDAYVASMSAPRRYDKSWQCDDETFMFATEKLSGGACHQFFDNAVGLQKDSMSSAIILYTHPEYQGWHKSLQNMDLSMEAQFGPDWQKQDSAKPRRRLPDVDLLCEGQQSEYEF